MMWRRLFLALKLLLVTILFISVTAPEWPAFADELYRLNALVGLHRFDFVVWEVKAFLVKGEAILANGHAYLDETTRRQVVLDYLALVQEVGRLEAEINRFYVDPQVSDPDASSRDLQAQLAARRATLARLQPTAEAIVQDQVGAVLVDEGLALLGQPWPPVLMRVTPLPLILVVSPRERIESIRQISLEPGLPIPAREALESAVFDDLNRSALVVPIGGMGTYPAMIMETSSINWLVEVTAHEWVHHWLTLRPLGIRYGLDPRVRTINETVASMVDQEIGALVIERFYPEFLPPPPAEPSSPAPLDPDPTLPPPFDFNAEMAETRITADRLLAEGQIEAAEAYMEARRRFFVTNGYNIRKLNQAYFAFYGAYAAEPGATGADPIGPMLREIRAQSPSIRAFLERVAPITSFEDLETLLRTMNDNAER